MGKSTETKRKRKVCLRNRGCRERYGLYAVSVLCPLLLPGHHGCQCCGNGVSILFIARIFDAFNDPIMGIIVAKTKTRWGKFRPWLFIGTLTNAIVLYLMFAAPPALSGRGLVAYAAVTYILWGVTYTMMDIPYWSMIPAFRLPKAEKERENLSAMAFLCRRWFCHCHDHYCFFCIHAWQAGRMGKVHRKLNGLDIAILH